MRIVSLLLPSLLGACASSSAPPPTAPPAPAECRPLAFHGEFPRELAVDTYEGALSLATGSDAADREEELYVLTLARPFCAAPDGAAITELQVYSADPAIADKLRALVGKRIRATGPGFEAHTAHHHRPAVIVVQSLDALQ